MATRSQNTNVDSVGTNRERLIRGSRTLANVTYQLQDVEMKATLPPSALPKFSRIQLPELPKTLH